MCLHVYHFSHFILYLKILTFKKPTNLLTSEQMYIPEINALDAESHILVQRYTDS